jgi:hypothetical protein
MIRTTLLALVSALTLGTASAALAAQLDGDANFVPGAQVSRSASDIERSYAGPHRQTITMQDRASFDRHSQVD